MAHALLDQAIDCLPSEASCRQAALNAERGSVEEGATWPYLWPGGLRLAEDLIDHTADFLPMDQNSLEHAHVVDLGCGRGLLGMLALCLGFQRVSFMDGDDLPLGLIAQQLSDFPKAQCRLLEWGGPIPGDAADILLGGDVLYRPAYHNSLLHSISESLAPNGIAYLGDPRKKVEENLSEVAEQHGLDYKHMLRQNNYSLVQLTNQQ